LLPTQERKILPIEKQEVFLSIKEKIMFSSDYVQKYFILLVFSYIYYFCDTGILILSTK